MRGAGGRGVIIAGTHSGCGKTTVTLGVLAALRKKGLTVQPFKAGPDFIDSGLHRLVSDRPSRNLDQWMCGRDFVVDCFAKHAAGADIAVVEGVMGMYDGDCSTAGLAALLGIPVVLVVDASGMAESAGAVVSGFAEFEVQSSEFRAKNKPVKFGGVIFNRVASEHHYARLKAGVRDVSVLGYLPREIDFEIPHRHLGLTTAEERPLDEESVDKLAEAVLAHVDIDLIVRIAGAVKRGPRPARRTGSGSRFKLAVAYDKAFCFYYEDNLDLLREAGADIMTFSPLADSRIPDGADAVYIGGGYPELHAAELSRNDVMRGALGAWAVAGKPLYAECGGLMYLSKGIRDFDNRFFAMAGVFSFETRMMKKPRLGYREIRLNEDCVLGNKGERCRGHEFHYSEIDAGTLTTDERDRKDIYAVSDKAGGHVRDEGFRFMNTLASYVHVHFGSNPRIAEQFATFIKGVTTA
jgi:cobyrinic acid a,c-diamide synthase